MSEQLHRHIGDNQLIRGIPKHMTGISTGVMPEKVGAAHARNASQAAAGSQRSYWTVHPELGACAACSAMEGLRFIEEQQRPHPNCKCEIRRHPMPVVSIFETLNGFEDHETHRFAAWQKITVTVRNWGPFPAGARILVDRDWGHAQETGLMPPGSSLSFEFTKFGEIPVPWQVELFYNAGDNSLLSYTIRG